MSLAFRLRVSFARGLSSLNALSHLCYAEVVDFEKGERRIGLLFKARAGEISLAALVGRTRESLAGKSS